MSLLMITGCGGCTTAKPKTEEEIAAEAAKEKEKPKPNFETNTPVLLPGIYPAPKADKEQTAASEDEDADEDLLAKAIREGDSVIRFNRVKLGHWYTASFQAIANNFNADGQLFAYSMDGMGRPVRIPATDYYFATSRPVALPQGEWKNFETSVFLPPRNKNAAGATVNFSMSRSESATAQISLPQSTLLLKPFQYHLVVLSTQSDGYAYLNLADPIRLAGQTGAGEVLDPFYVVVPTEPNRPLPLPRQSLNWTTVAYLIWDDWDPTTIDTDHQAAILDWIHFGGQLIVSGPDSLDKLQNSFLGPYLPAQFDSSRNLTNADLEELNKNWTVPALRNQAENRSFQVAEGAPLLGVNFAPHENAKFVDGTGEIAIERRVGRGRIVATAFSLKSPAVRKWRSFKSFLNGALLRRPARNFGTSPASEVRFEWVGDGTKLFDPLLNSTLRYLSRDLAIQGGTSMSPAGLPAGSSKENGIIGFAAPWSELSDEDEFNLKDSVNQSQSRNLNDDFHYGGFQDVEQAGTGSWNDNSGISYAARETLKEAAGITPPPAAFVLKMLAAYLLVLVPLNWLFFRLIGRVELAWLAAPVIAIIGAFMVVRMASLDIGFVRSNSQVGLLEVQANYSRAHLAEYSALYTSLSTGYNVDLDNETAQSLPFATTANPATYSSDKPLSRVQLRRTVKNRLEGFQIQSNSTGLLHTEYMLDLEGAFSFTPPEAGEPMLSNATVVDLVHAAVIGRDQDGSYKLAVIGELAADSSADLKFEACSRSELGAPWKGKLLFQNTTAAAKQIWAANFDQADSATLGDLKAIADLETDWSAYEQLLLQTSQDPEYLFTRNQFVNIFQLVNSTSEVNLGRMLSAVLENLSLGKGEYRLLGATSQRLGKTKFDPASTQVDQQTLVVAHLQMPKLPIAARDLNAFEDFKARSSLDWEKEIEELDKLQGQLQD